MPKLSRFYGIEICIRTREANHTRAHFHAAYGEFEASIAVDDLAVLAGTLPNRTMKGYSPACLCASGCSSLAP